MLAPRAGYWPDFCMGLRFLGSQEVRLVMWVALVNQLTIISEVLCKSGPTLKANGGHELRNWQLSTPSKFPQCGPGG